MQAHILSLHTPRPPGLGQKVKTFFSESSPAAFQNKWSTMQAHIPYTHPQLLGWFKGKQNLNMVMLHIKFKGRKYRPT